MQTEKEYMEYTIKRSLKIIRMYDWLLDLYVLDFFIDNHWEKLPTSWQECFRQMDPKDLGEILSGHPTSHVLPLSFLCLLHNIKMISLSRRQCDKFRYNAEENNNLNGEYGNHPKLKNLFLKHVKLKKRHEVSVMSKVVAKTAIESKCNAVVDFGSGLGHLVRMVAYRYELYAAGIECQSELSEEARKLDLELEYTAKKHISDATVSKLHRPIHINITLSTTDQLEMLNLPDYIRNNYGLIGLHPCGDLGPLLLKHFVNSSSVKFICLVGCCYMKLTEAGYPLSKYALGLDSKLSYVSREIACHAIETYCDRLRKGKYEDLKIHAYRAALERILVEYDPRLKHAPVKNIKHFNSLTFHNYCLQAVERLNIPLPSSLAVWSRGLQDLAAWRRVVVLYSLRLALAPLVETVLLCDRALYVMEQEFVASLSHCSIDRDRIGVIVTPLQWNGGKSDLNLVLSCARSVLPDLACV